MDVGGFILPPTNTLTGLLYGFHHHTDHDAREYYFWRLCDELFNNPDLCMEDNFADFTIREQEEVLRHVSLFEDRIHKLLGVKFKEITSSTNFTKSI